MTFIVELQRSVESKKIGETLIPETEEGVFGKLH